MDDKIVDLTARRAEIALAEEEWASIEGDWVRPDITLDRLVQVLDVDDLRGDMFDDIGIEGHVVTFRCNNESPLVLMSADEAEAIGVRLLKASAFAKIKNHPPG